MSYGAGVRRAEDEYVEFVSVVGDGFEIHNVEGRGRAERPLAPLQERPRLALSVLA